MMGFDMGFGMLMMLIGLIILLAAAGAIVYLGIRAGRRGDSLEEGDSARALLDRRLAIGEISAEEYYERESALRDAQPVARRR